MYSKFLEVVSNLAPIIENGDCIAWVGAGLSKIARYPGWAEAVRELCRACGVSSLSSSDEADPDRLIDKAQECKEANQQAYEDTLGRLFGGEVVETRQAFSLLMLLPFKGYVTTNFDPLLVEAGISHGYTNLCVYPALYSLHLERLKRPIFHIHGLARNGGRPRGDRLVLARSDFEEAYGDEGVVSVFLAGLLLNYDILFIGCGLTEPAITEVFRRVHGINTVIQRQYPQASPRRRCAVLPMRMLAPSMERRLSGKRQKPDPMCEERDAGREHDENQRFREFGVEVIRKDPWDISRLGGMRKI